MSSDKRNQHIASMPSLRFIDKDDIITLDLIGIGGFSDIYSGVWVDGDRQGLEKLAVKFFREIKTDDQSRLQRRLYCEISTWLSVQPHPNILPFIGIYQHDPERLPALVSPLREAGEVLEYLSKNDFHCRPLALGIATGLAHLHAHDIVHGDLKPKNVLIHINAEGKPTPEISDFGRAKILNVKGFTGSLHTTRRYTAPEVLNPTHTLDSPVIGFSQERENVALTKASDVWSLGMVLLHVISGQEPYPGLNESQIVLALDRELEPREHEHPRMLTCPIRGGMWPLLRRCWKLAYGPEARCSAQNCVDELKILIDEHAHN